jgi:hypothetical protein
MNTAADLMMSSDAQGQERFPGSRDDLKRLAAAWSLPVAAVIAALA